MSKKSKKKAPQAVAVPSPADWPLRQYLLGGIGAFLFLYPWAGIYTQLRPETGLNAIAAWVILILFLATGYGLAARKLEVPRSWLFWPIAAYALFFGVSGFQSRSWYVALTGGLGPNTDGYGFFLLMLTFAWCVLALRPRLSEMRALLAALHIQIFLIGIGIFFEFHFRGLPYRATSLLRNPDYYLSYGLLLLPSALWFCRTTWQTGGNLIWRLRYPALAAVLVSSLWLCLPYGLQTTLLPVGRHAKQPPATTVDEFISSESNQERFSLWQTGWESALAKPVLGNGPGSVSETFYGRVNEVPTWNYNFVPTSYHDDLLDRFSESGIFGLLSYVAIWICLFVGYFRSRRSLEPENRLFAGLLLAGVGAMFLFDLLAFRVAFTSLALWLFVPLIAIAGGWVGYRRTSPSARGLIAAWAVVVLIGAIASGNLWQADVLATQGQQATAARRDVGTAFQDFSQAASLIPQEPLYWRQEAANGLYLAVTLRLEHGDPSYESAVTIQSIQAGLTAARLAPYDPLTVGNAGVVEYALSAPGSAEEADGLALLTKAKAIYPADLVLYRSFIQAFSLKQGSGTLTQAQGDLLFKNTPPSVTKQLPAFLAQAQLTRP